LLGQIDLILQSSDDCDRFSFAVIHCRIDERFGNGLRPAQGHVTTVVDASAVPSIAENVEMIVSAGSVCGLNSHLEIWFGFHNYLKKATNSDQSSNSDPLRKGKRRDLKR
jgi:hypothetical protein